MSNRQIPFPIWLLRTYFLSIVYCVTLFQRVQSAAVTDPIEVKVVKSLAQKWNIESSAKWNLTGDPCTGLAIDSTPLTDVNMNPAFKCDCTFNNGKTCHIIQMNVYAVDKTGQIPPELVNLTQLSGLNLAQNCLTGPIPAFLGNLTQMQYLSLAANNLSGPIPKELVNLRSLISLSVAENKLNGSLPRELGSVTTLQEL
eukprot:PITA_32722